MIVVRPMTRPPATALLLPILLLVVGACASGAATAPTGSLSAPSPSPSPSTSPAAVPPTTADEAAALVIASDPRFTGIGKKNPDLIGACCFYEATPTGGGSFAVTIEIGWGDCPAGCTDRHRWFYIVNQDGAIALQREEGDPAPVDVGGSATGTGGWDLPGGPGIAGTALAGPTCPVVQPGDNSCNDRPVAGATILIRDAHGTVVAQMTTGPDGSFQASLPPGTYRVEPQPVEGLMGGADTVDVTVGASFQFVTISYDTGIR
jgi:hypothetical protein